MLTALDNLSVRPLDAINLIRTMLKVDVNIIPMSEHPSDLTALATNGKWVTGETSVASIMPPLLLPKIGQAIFDNQKAKVIFIENLSPEYGPAGRMSLKQKLEWCERACKNRKIDVVIGPKEHSRFGITKPRLAS